MERVIRFYADRCRQYGDNGWQASSWFSAEDQINRFMVALRGIEHGSSILDVGCGQGELSAYVPAGTYTGIDICPEMIVRAGARFPGTSFFVRDIFEYDERSADTALAIGTFGLDVGENYEYLSRGLDALLRVAPRGVAVFPNADTSFRHPGVFFYDPETVHGIAARIAGSHTIDTSALSHEMVLRVERRAGGVR